MLDDLTNANSRPATRLQRLSRELHKPGFRHGFVARQLKAFLAQQIRALRGHLSQTEFGAIIGKPQSVVSRIEKQLDKNISIQTLIDIATKLDIAVIIRFVDFPTFLRYTEDYSDAALVPKPYDHSEIEAMAKEPSVENAQQTQDLIPGNRFVDPLQSLWLNTSVGISGYYGVVNALKLFSHGPAQFGALSYGTASGLASPINEPSLGLARSALSNAGSLFDPGKALLAQQVAALTKQLNEQARLLAEKEQEIRDLRHKMEVLNSTAENLIPTGVHDNPWQDQRGAAGGLLLQ